MCSMFEKIIFTSFIFEIACESLSTFFTLNQRYAFKFKSRFANEFVLMDFVLHISLEISLYFDFTFYIFKF